MSKNTPHYKEVDLFGNENIRIINRQSNRAQTSLLDYEGFLEKFEPKKTTDDCYTPTEVYRTILNFLSERVDISGCNIIRPFYPGGDYESVEYKDSDVVIDNPPFSFISQIARFYIQRGVRFFIFAPHLTLFSSDLECTYVVCGASIIYENGANVKTSFLSNLFSNVKVLALPSLYSALKDVQRKDIELPKYKYPNNVLTVSSVQKLVERGIAFSVENSHAKHIRSLDSQRTLKKAVFGSGFLLSGRAAADKAAAELAAESNSLETPMVMTWELSDREQKIIKGLGHT